MSYFTFTHVGKVQNPQTPNEHLCLNSYRRIACTKKQVTLLSESLKKKKKKRKRHTNVRVICIEKKKKRERHTNVRVICYSELFYKSNPTVLQGKENMFLDCKEYDNVGQKSFLVHAV